MMVKLINNIRKASLNDYTTVFFFDILGKVIVGLQTIIIIRLLSISDYAKYTNFNEISIIIQNFIGSGLAMTYITKMSVNPNARFFLYKSFSKYVIVSSGIVLCLTNLLSNIYQIENALVVLSIILGCTLSLTKLAQCYYQVKGEYAFSGKIINYKNILIFLFLVLTYVALKKVTVFTLCVAVVVSTMVSYFLIYKRLYTESISDFTMNQNIIGAYDVLKSSFWLLGYLFFANSFNTICLFIANKFGTPNDVAAFGVSIKYFSIAMLLLSSIQTVLRVKTCQNTFINDKTYRNNFINNWTRKTLFISSAIALLFGLLSKYVFPILNGDKYPESIVLFQILMVALILGYTFSINTVIMISLGKEKVLFIISLICWLIAFLTCYSLYPYIGIYSAACSIIISNFLLNFSNYLILKFQK